MLDYRHRTIEELSPVFHPLVYYSRTLSSTCCTKSVPLPRSAPQRTHNYRRQVLYRVTSHKAAIPTRATPRGLWTAGNRRLPGLRPPDAGFSSSPRRRGSRKYRTTRYGSLVPGPSLRYVRDDGLIIRLLSDTYPALSAIRQWVFVIPAKAGIQRDTERQDAGYWFPDLRFAPSGIAGRYAPSNRNEGERFASSGAVLGFPPDTHPGHLQDTSLLYRSPEDEGDEVPTGCSKKHIRPYLCRLDVPGISDISAASNLCRGTAVPTTTSG